MRGWLIVALLAWQGPGITPASRHTEPQQSAARDYAVEGVGFSVRLDEFLKRFPDARRDPHSQAAWGLVQYTILAEGARAAEFYFCDQALYRIRLVRDPAAAGAASAADLLAQLTAQFGRPDETESPTGGPRRYHWRMPAVERRILWVDPGPAQPHTLDVVNLDVEDRVLERLDVETRGRGPPGAN